MLKTRAKLQKKIHIAKLNREISYYTIINSGIFLTSTLLGILGNTRKS